MIYIAHPNSVANKRTSTKYKQLSIDLALKLFDHTFYSPLHAMGFFVRRIGTILTAWKYCFEALSRCDVVDCRRLVENQRMLYGMRLAKGKGIPRFKFK